MNRELTKSRQAYTELAAVCDELRHELALMQEKVRRAVEVFVRTCVPLPVLAVDRAASVLGTLCFAVPDIDEHCSLCGQYRSEAARAAFLADSVQWSRGHSLPSSSLTAPPRSPGDAGPIRGGAAVASPPQPPSPLYHRHVGSPAAAHAGAVLSNHRLPVRKSSTVTFRESSDRAARSQRTAVGYVHVVVEEGCSRRGGRRDVAVLVEEGGGSVGGEGM